MLRMISLLIVILGNLKSYQKFRNMPDTVTEPDVCQKHEQTSCLCPETKYMFKTLDKVHLFSRRANYESIIWQMKTVLLLFYVPLQQLFLVQMTPQVFADQ